MTHAGRAVFTSLAVLAAIATFDTGARAQPNPYRLVDNWAKLPASMNAGKWGEVIGVKPGPDGSIYVSDEYGPYLFQFDLFGHSRRRLPIPD